MSRLAGQSLHIEDLSDQKTRIRVENLSFWESAIKVRDVVGTLKVVLWIHNMINYLPINLKWLKGQYLIANQSIYYYSVELKEFFQYSDFTWNQFRYIHIYRLQRQKTPLTIKIHRNCFHIRSDWRSNSQNSTSCLHERPFFQKYTKKYSDIQLQSYHQQWWSSQLMYLFLFCSSFPSLPK